MSGAGEMIGETKLFNVYDISMRHKISFCAAVVRVGHWNFSEFGFYSHSFFNVCLQQLIIMRIMKGLSLIREVCLEIDIFMSLLYKCC